MLHQQNNRDLYLRVRALARQMRKNSTQAEEFFWRKVRDRRLFGLKFNRQYIIQCPINSVFTKYYIADFHCSYLKLIIELDGQIHLRQASEDMIRTDQIRERGYLVVRFTNEQVLDHWDEVEKILFEIMRKIRN